MTRNTKEEVIEAARSMKPGGLRDLDHGTYEIAVPIKNVTIFEDTIEAREARVREDVEDVEEEEDEECTLCIAEMQELPIDVCITAYIVGFMAALAVSLDDPMQHQALKFCKKHHERIGEAHQSAMSVLLHFLEGTKGKA